ncbi:hypothetical protein [Lignipirellula cremea]|uniref:hypothetical protein n=1 Tax=Lignipirellula cremea TaxID=2528010 RepID=UPI0011A42085|nr:hypothetical protein [Lignipirellula cremea]
MRGLLLLITGLCLFLAVISALGLPPGDLLRAVLLTVGIVCITIGLVEMFRRFRGRHRGDELLWQPHRDRMLPPRPASEVDAPEPGSPPGDPPEFDQGA